MKPVRLWSRRLHRWLGLAVAIQLLAWMASGFYFTLYPIEEIRGEHLIEPAPDLGAVEMTGLMTPAATAAALREAFGEVRVESLELVARGGRAYYRAGFSDAAGRNGMRLVDARTGVLEPGVSADTAARIATARFKPQARVREVARITDVAGGHEYRGGPFPAYRVEFDHDSGARVYVAEQSGEVTAVRTANWRVFDFFWMLHIMDYNERQDFSHPLITAVAALGGIIILTGFVLWLVTTPLLRRGRRVRAPEPRR